ncbi:AMP-binding protein [Ochrobactrum sp. XJ1]|nr:AMP-binding protein [Ochrobactrum sp. XJ1]
MSKHLDSAPSSNAAGGLGPAMQNAFLPLKRSAERAPDKAAIHYYGTTTTYSELLGQCVALAGYLTSRCGIKPGDRVLLDMQNSPQFVIAYYAILRANAVVVPVNPMNREAELRRVVENSGARCAIAGIEVADFFSGMVGKDLDHVITARYADMLIDEIVEPLPPILKEERRDVPAGFIDMQVAIAADLVPDEISAGPDDIALLCYTSGSTGVPKACIHPHKNLTFIQGAAASWYRLDETLVMGVSMPMFHITGLQICIGTTIACGGAIVPLTRWDRNAIASLFARYKATFWSTAPPMINDVVNSDNFTDGAFESLKILTGGGAPMPVELARRLGEKYGVVYCEGYGLSETCSATHICPVDSPKLGSIGVPIYSTRALIVDPETLEELAGQEIGELLISGPQVMRGYWNSPEATAETLIERDGAIFLRTGDLGYKDPDGYFFIVDRLKRVINASGFKVWPAECERVLQAHPAVRECCVVSAPDSYRGETVRAVIVLHTGFETTTSDDIIAFARSQMSAYKVPRIVDFVESLPTLSSGKVDWRKVQTAAA